MPHHLFSFSTTRNPTAMPDNERRRFHIFIQDSDRQNTHYWSDLIRGTSRILIQTIRSRASTAPELPRLDELSDRFRSYLEIYRDAHSENRRASIAGTIDLILDGSVPPLQRADRILLWDLLAEGLLIHPNKAIVDTVRAIFVASQLIEAVRLFEDNDSDTVANEAIVRRIAEARVVLPLQVENIREESPPDRVSDRQRDMLETAHDRLLEQTEIDELEQARLEITALALESSIGTQRELENERDRAERRIVSALSSTLSASAFAAILPTLRNSVATAVTIPQPNFAETVAARATPRTARLVARLAVGAATSTPVALLANLEAEIDDRETDRTDSITNVHQTTFLAFGAEIVVEEVIPKGLTIFKVLRPPEGGFHVYMTYHHGGDLPPIAAIGGEIGAAGTNHPVREVEIDHGNALFQTFRLTGEPIVSSSFDLDLTFQSAAPDSAPVSLDLFRLFSSRPRFRLLDLNPFDNLGVPPKPLFGVNRLGIIDYRRVEQELSCYVTGEVSRIENIMASQFKERVSRNLSIIETEQLQTQEVASERQSDTETAERMEMQSQVDSVLREQSGFTFDTGLAVHAKLPGGSSLDTNASFNYNTQSSREDSTSDAIKMAKEVTRRVQEKLVQKATSTRRSLSRREYEDINKHGFDNRQNPDHVVGVFRWVDKVMTNRLVNYGQLNVLEFDIPEPARNLIRAQEQAQDKDAVLPPRPRRPVVLGLHGPESITRKNWRRFAAAYRVDIDPPPPNEIILARSYADSALTMGGEGAEVNIERKLAYNDIEIPTDYRANHAWVVADIHEEIAPPTSGTPGSLGTNGTLQVSVGGEVFMSPDGEGHALSSVAGTLPISVSCNRVFDFAIGVRVRCKLRTGIFQAWQMETYSILMDAYRKMRDAYRDARAEHLEESKTVDLNPRFKKLHMERELKRVCIEMLTKPFLLDVTADHYDAAPAGELFKLRQDPALDRHAELVRFFEHAFWWEIMSYAFYPYFYADRATWTAKLTMEATRDALFGSFLSAGMGRVMLPIRPGFEEAVMYYMQTGEVWFGSGFVVDSENDLYLSIADEASRRREVDEVVEDTWQTLLPTNHTMLQSAAAAMIGEGLPCTNIDNRLGMGQSRLSPVLPPVAGDNP
ncbi:MAG: hypothetical protein ABL888_12905 [Pirellulaceae bacterium]